MWTVERRWRSPAVGARGCPSRARSLRRRPRLAASHDYLYFDEVTPAKANARGMQASVLLIPIIGPEAKLGSIGEARRLHSSTPQPNPRLRNQRALAWFSVTMDVRMLGGWWLICAIVARHRHHANRHASRSTPPPIASECRYHFKPVRYKTARCLVAPAARHRRSLAILHNRRECSAPANRMTFVHRNADAF